MHQEGEEDPVLEGRPGAEAGRLGVAGHREAVVVAGPQEVAELAAEVERPAV